MAPQFLGITGLALANKRDRKRTRCHVYFELLRWENPTVSHPFEHRSNGRKAPLGRPFLLSISGTDHGLGTPCATPAVCYKASLVTNAPVEFHRQNLKT